MNELWYYGNIAIKCVAGGILGYLIFCLVIRMKEHNV